MSSYTYTQKIVQIRYNIFKKKVAEKKKKNPNI